MNDKPIIRHCRNCAYSKDMFYSDLKCCVKYKYIQNKRLTALLCRYYKVKNNEKV